MSTRPLGRRCRDRRGSVLCRSGATVSGVSFLAWANGLDRRVRTKQAAWADRSVLMSRYGGYVGKNLDEDIDALKARIALLESKLQGDR